MRLSTNLVIILLLMNGMAGVITQSGVGDDWGINPSVGGDQVVKNTQENASQVKPSAGFGDTLFSLFTSIGSTFETIYNLIFYGPKMLQNLGIPWWLVDPFNAVLLVIWAKDVAYIFSGRDI